jgi:hypothetical protein
LLAKPSTTRADRKASPGWEREAGIRVVFRVVQLTRSKGSNMQTRKALINVTVVIWFASGQPVPAQVNMQYNGQYSGQYLGQYGGQFSGQFSGEYYGRGTDETASPTARDRRYGISGYPVNSGECGELHYPSPSTDYVFHDSQGRRCY